MLVSDTPSLPLAARFFAPITGIAAACPSTRSCPGLSDEAWLQLAILRAILDKPSGRAFLQEAEPSLEISIARSTFFETLRSERRLRFCREANALLAAQMKNTLPDPFASFPDMQDFNVFAGDGHFHAAATHDPRSEDGVKYSTGHLYLLNLRTHCAHHLDVGSEGKKEHDMHILKRQTKEKLRCGTPTGEKVIFVYDRAGIDFAQWHAWKSGSGIYFISRPKENMNLDVQGAHEYDAGDPVNTGIVSDEFVAPLTHGRMIRRITFLNPLNGEHWQVITNEMTLPPGLVAKLYLMRWDIEKMFDEFKNKIMERKSWASSLTAKSMQAVILCLTHNLMLLQEHSLRCEHGITNQAEDRRREKRLSEEKIAVQKAGRPFTPLKEALQRCTQRSVKFIRWLRTFLFRNDPWEQMLGSLHKIYSTS